MQGKGAGEMVNGKWGSWIIKNGELIINNWGAEMQGEGAGEMLNGELGPWNAVP